MHAVQGVEPIIEEEAVCEEEIENPEENGIIVKIIQWETVTCNSVACQNSKK